MSIEDKNIVDAIGLDDMGLIVLTISDHLSWDDEHLFILQDKLNTYVSFIESGEVYEVYPESRNRKFKINIVCKYEPTDSALLFISKCRELIHDADFQFDYTVFS